MAQLVAFGETPLRLSTPNHHRLEQARTAQFSADGTESNAAVAAHALGTRTIWTSILPNSPLGRRVHTEIDAQGVETDVSFAPGQQALVFHEPAVSPREPRQVHHRAETPMATASPSDLPMHRIQDADMIVTGLTTAVLSQEMAETATALLRAGSGAGAQTVVAFDYDPELAAPEVYQGVFEELAPHTDVVVGTERALTRGLEREDTHRELASGLTFEYDIGIAAVITPGEGGTTIENTPGTNVAHERDGLDTHAVDRAGEFGATVGGVCHALVHGATAAEALDTGLAAGALAGSISGPFLQSSADELERVLAQVTTQPSGSRY